MSKAFEKTKTRHFLVIFNYLFNAYAVQADTCMTWTILIVLSCTSVPSTHQFQSNRLSLHVYTHLANRDTHCPQMLKEKLESWSNI